MNHQIRLKSRPTGEPTAANFEAADGPVPETKDGEVLRRTIYLSLDPYMRGRMSDGPSYATPVQIGEVMGGHTVSEVVESRNPAFARGAFVTGYDGWQAYGVSNGKELRTLDPQVVPISTAIGVLGMPGMTAFVGLMDIGQPKPGETVVVSAASGAVGAVVGQLAKIKGCRVVGIAGGQAKCDWVVRELGFDACIDYKAGNLRGDLKEATPKGIDCLFENVGGEIFDTLLTRMNPFSRIALCGLIAQYNSAPYPMQNIGSVLINRIRMQGFIVSDDLSRWPLALKELAGHVAAGRIKYRESVANGLAAAPAAFISLLKGGNFGKQLVKLV